MHGEERPAGTSAFQSRFVPGPNSTGGLSPSATPEEFGPRNWGHWGTAANEVEQATRRAKGRQGFIGTRCLDGLSGFHGQRVFRKAVGALRPASDKSSPNSWHLRGGCISSCRRARQ